VTHALGPQFISCVAVPHFEHSAHVEVKNVWSYILHFPMSSCYDVN